MRAQDHLPLAHILVRGIRVDLSEETIYKFLFGLKFAGLVTITKFDYR